MRHPKKQRFLQDDKTDRFAHAYRFYNPNRGIMCDNGHTERNGRLLVRNGTTFTSQVLHINWAVDRLQRRLLGLDLPAAI